MYVNMQYCLVCEVKFLHDVVAQSCRGFLLGGKLKRKLAAMSSALLLAAIIVAASFENVWPSGFNPSNPAKFSNI